MNSKAPPTAESVVRTFRVNAIAIAIAMAVLGVMVVTVYTIRDHDLDKQLRENRAINERQAQTIRYLCESVILQDVTVVQQAAFLRIVLNNQKFASLTGPHERDLLRQREAALQAVHDELSSQRAQRACKDFQ
jgi:hypothetical protein